MRPGGAGAFGVDEGSETNRADLDALIAAVNAGGPLSEQVGPLADLTEMTREWAVERYIAHWDGYAGWDDSAYAALSPFGGFSPNNYFLHSDASGRFSMLPWGADQTWSPFALPEGIRPIGFDDGQAIMFTRCLADPACAALYRSAVDGAASTIGALDLDALADATAALLRPWQERDPRREATLAEIDAGVAGVHEFLRVRAARGRRVADAACRHRRPRSCAERRRLVRRAGDDRLAGDRRQRPGDRPARHHRLDRGRERRLFERAELRHLVQLRDRIPGAQHRLGRAQRSRRRSSPATILLHAIASATPHATDATSGVSSQSCESPDTSSVGAKTLTCTATDNAGNSTTVSVAYMVQYRILGFFEPAAKAKWKGGQTVPIKIALGDANGNRISDAEAQGLLSPTCRVTFVATGAQSASACMKYDTASHQFIYNWKLGQPIGGVTISVQVGYAGTAIKTVLSETIAITR